MVGLLDMPDGILEKIFAHYLSISWFCVNFPLSCRRTLFLLQLAKRHPGVAILLKDRAYCHAQNISRKHPRPLWFLKLYKPRLLYVICTNPKSDENTLSDSNTGAKRHVDSAVLAKLTDCFQPHQVVMFFDSKPVYKVWHGKLSFRHNQFLNRHPPRPDGVYPYHANYPYSWLTM